MATVSFTAIWLFCLGKQGLTVANQHSASAFGLFMGQHLSWADHSILPSWWIPTLDAMATASSPKLAKKKPNNNNNKKV
jgi:hypothetical protein